MRIQVFHAGDGDCLLLTIDELDDDGVAATRSILVDGGRATQFREHARDEIYRPGGVRRDVLDLVYISHIDDDHISGIVAMLDDMVEWRVHEHRLAHGTATSEPSSPKPPEIAEIWHNALFELVGDAVAPEVAGALAAAAVTLAGSPDEPGRERAARLDNLATGERSSMEVSRRISSEQLNIPRNRNQVLMQLGDANFRRIGPFFIEELGPSSTAIDDLRERWHTWILNHRQMLRDLQARMLDDEDRLGADVPVAPPGLITELGDGGISEPNLASLMLLVKDRQNGSRILLTGDGSSDDILAGLEHHRRLDGNRSVHVDAFKIPHHGALANVTRELVDSVTADHYIFCGNGAHHNPELDVVEALAMARLGQGGVHGDFTFWFSSRHDSPGLSDARSEHMRAVETLVHDIQRTHDTGAQPRFRAEFLRDGHHDIVI